MSQVVMSLREREWEQGKRFFFLHSDLSFGIGATKDFVICLDPNVDGVLENFGIVSDAASLTWQPFAGTLLQDPANGTPIDSLARNATADTKCTGVMILNPDIQADGQPIQSQPTDLIALTGAGSRNLLDREIITEDFAFNKGLCYMVRIVNTSGATCKISINIGFRNA